MPPTSVYCFSSGLQSYHITPVPSHALPANAIALAERPHILFVESRVTYTMDTVRRFAFPAGREHEH